MFGKIFLDHIFPLMAKKKKTNRQRGEELNQLARLLFDNASDNFYLSVGIEIVAGLVGIVASLMVNSDIGKFLSAVMGFALLAWSYFLRLRFDEKYDRAETMRRQSVLVEALNWNIGISQFNDWRRMAGQNILEKFRVQPRNADYYETKVGFGGKRLLLMTYESCFYTKFLYCKLKDFILYILLFSLVLIVAVYSVLPMNVFSSLEIKIAYTIYLLLPVILSSDLLGWYFKLDRLIKSLAEVEGDLERLDKSKKYTEADVMRLVSEYNCQVASGFPIHNWIFNKWHQEIKSLWDSR